MKAGLIVLAAPALGLLTMFGLIFVVLAPQAPQPFTLTGSGCVPQLPNSSTGVHLDDQQWSVARTIIDVGRELKVGPRGWIVALAAGMQESGLRPLTYGDRDSLGVFQQRAAWGSARDRINPTASARMFFTGGHGGQPGLLDIAGWQDVPVTDAAQAVQLSAYPDAYAKWEGLADGVVQRLGGVTGCARSGWVFPLGETHYVLTAGFGECGSHWANCHTGQDFAVPTGTPVVAAGGGVVTFAGWAGAYGNAVHLLHTSGVATWYCHLSRLETSRGNQIRAGEVLGLSGATGNATGPHLHFEVRTGATATSDGTPIDPMPFLHDHHLI